MPVPPNILATDVSDYAPPEVEEADNTFDDNDRIAMLASTHTWIIPFIFVKLLKLLEDSTMVKYFDQQGWTDLVQVTTLGIEEFKDFYTVKDDSFTFEAQPMWVHIRLLNGSLLYFWRKCKVFSATFSTDNVINGCSLPVNSSMTTSDQNHSSNLFFP
jgi:hypothetical protein